MNLSQDDLYRNAAEQFGPALDRLARAYELNPDKRCDLKQEIHLQLWRSFATYDSRCSIRTWVYRVGHNVAASHVLRELRIHSPLISLEELDLPPLKPEATQHLDAVRLTAWIQQLKPLDRQVIILYLEDLDAASIGEITGLSPEAVAMRIHRIKDLLARKFQQGGVDAK